MPQAQSDHARTEGNQGELFTGGELQSLPWAAIIVSRKTADDLEAAGEIEWDSDHYRYANEPRTETSIEWLATIGLRLEALRLDPFDYRVLAHLIWRAGARGTCWPTYDHIANATGISRRRIAMSLASLRDKGAIRIKTGHEGRANEYEIRGDLVQNPVESSAYQCMPCTPEPENSENSPEFRTDQCTTCTPTLQQYNSPTKIASEGGDLFGLDPEAEIPSTTRNNELFAFFLPANLGSDTRVMIALGQFEADRRERKKKMTRQAIKILCHKVATWEPDQIVEAVAAAIEKGWTSLYLPRENACASPGAPGAPQAPKTQDYGAWSETTAK